MKQLGYSKQTGMSAILFAMVFTIILSLLSVGFATLVRQDQRETLDKTLSYQAQYAAETAINRTANSLLNNPTMPPESTACDGSTAGVGATAMDISLPTSSASAKVTCITWTSNSDRIVKDPLGANRFISKIRPNTGSSISFLQFTWQQNPDTGSVNAYPAANVSGALGLRLPTLNTTNIGLLRVTLMDGSGVTKTLYLIPTTTTVNADFGSQTGQIGLATCTSGTCTVTINNYNVSDVQQGYLSMFAYGGTAANVTVTTNPGTNFVGAQAVIDANAIAQDVSKRVSARVPLTAQTWGPSFGVAANSICKDYKVDGQQTMAASSAAATVCP